MTPVPADDPRITALGLFAEVNVGLNARLAEQVARYGLAPIEFEVLIRLVRSPRGSLRMTDLSAQTSLTSSGITRLVDRLERDGLVHRDACPTDRRSSFAVISRAGRQRVDDILPGHLQLIEDLFTGPLEPAELDCLLGALRKIRAVVRPCATAGTEARTDSDRTGPVGTGRTGTAR